MYFFRRKVIHKSKFVSEFSVDFKNIKIYLTSNYNGVYNKKLVFGQIKKMIANDINLIQWNANERKY